MFASISPFNKGIHTALLQQYRARLLQALVDKQTNNRGYKRKLPVESCYGFLKDSWDLVPSSFIRVCSIKSQLLNEPILSDDYLDFSKTSTSQLEDSLRLFETTFTLTGEQLIPLSSYTFLETNPYINGFGSISECIRYKSFVPILFNHDFYPQSEYFPSLEEFLQHSNMVDVESPEKELEGENEKPLSQQEVFSDLLDLSVHFQPSPDVVGLFCTCLDDLMNHASEQFSQEDKNYYSQLKERICNHYGTHSFVFSENKSTTISRESY